jgi:hypothetical protein
VFKKYIAPFQWSFTLKHPASAAYRETDWNTEGVFTKVNKILKKIFSISTLPKCLANL